LTFSVLFVGHVASGGSSYICSSGNHLHKTYSCGGI